MLNTIVLAIIGWQWVIIFVIILLLFGGSKIPELMRGLGKGITEFKKGINDAKKELDDPLNDKGDKKV